jgi:hypothetical protein
MVASILLWGPQDLCQNTSCMIHLNEVYTQYFILLLPCVFLQLICQPKNALNKIQFMTFLIYYTARNYTLHVLHLDSISSDYTDLDRCVYAYSIQNINGCEHVLEPVHYHIVLISQEHNFMLVNFTYFRILKF